MSLPPFKSETKNIAFFKMDLFLFDKFSLLRVSESYVHIFFSFTLSFFLFSLNCGKTYLMVKFLVQKGYCLLYSMVSDPHLNTCLIPN